MEEHVLSSFHCLARWLAGRLGYFRFRIQRARAIPEARKDDPNIYPLWYIYPPW